MKEILYTHCKDFVQERLDRIELQMVNIRESLLSETKSTAGDKHETGRAMLQLEREKAGMQLSEAKKLQETVLKTNIKNTPLVVALGSLVFTTSGNYFICISAGAFHVENTSFYAIAVNTPIGKILLGKLKGDHFQFHEKKVTVITIK